MDPVSGHRCGHRLALLQLLESVLVLEEQHRTLTTCEPLDSWAEVRKYFGGHSNFYVRVDDVVEELLVFGPEEDLVYGK